MFFTYSHVNNISHPNIKNIINYSYSLFVFISVDNWWISERIV